jgi:hypothetical protein
VIFQVARVAGRSPFLQIGWGRYNNASRFAHFARDQAGVAQVTQANGNIHALFNNMHHAIGKREICSDAGIKRQELAHQWRDVHSSKHEWRSDDELTCGLCAFDLDGTVGFFQVSEDLSRALKISHMSCVENVKTAIGEDHFFAASLLKEGYELFWAKNLFSDHDS